MRRFVSGFRVFLRAVGVAALLATAAATAWADEAWKVTEVSGTARMATVDGSWSPVTVGAVVAPGGVVETGANGRVVLKSANDEATMSPNSRMEAPKPEDKNSNLVQKLGTLLFKIERAPARRFAVDTPYLAAVVKGTTFTVTVRADGGLVHVTEGAVLVASFASRETALVTPGQTAQILAAGGKLQVIERGRAVPTTPHAGKDKDNGKRGSNDTKTDDPKKLDAADQKLIEKGRAELEKAPVVVAQAAKEIDEASSRSVVSASSDRRTQVASLGHSASTKNAGSSSVVVISSPLGAQSVDVARATDGFIAGLPADPRPNNSNNGGGGSAGSATGNAGTSGETGHGSSNVVAAITAPVASVTEELFGNGNGNAGGNGNGNAGGNGNGNGNGNSNVVAAVTEGLSGNGNGNAGGNGSGNGNSNVVAAVTAPVAAITEGLFGNGNGNANPGGNNGSGRNAGGNFNAPAASAASAPQVAAPAAAVAPVIAAVAAPVTQALSTVGLLPLGQALSAPTTPTVTVPSNGHGNGNGNANGNGNGNASAAPSTPAASTPTPSSSATVPPSPVVAAAAPTTPAAVAPVVSTPVVSAPVAPTPVVTPPAVVAPVVNAVTNTVSTTMGNIGGLLHGLGKGKHK